MRVRRTCNDVTRLVFESQDRPLSLMETVSLRLHWLACGSCQRFRSQQQLMQQALQRWRQYRDGD